MTTPLLALNKIYLATEGEGINLGLAEIMVRLQGCAIGCRHCDTPAALAGQKPDRPVDEVYRAIHKLGLKRVSLTGGDPLAALQRAGVMELCQKLKAEGYWINLEAHGLTPLEDAAPVYDLVDFISADFKTPSSGHPGQRALLQGLCQNYATKLQIKSVIMHEEDFQFVWATYQSFRPWPVQVAWVLTPAFNYDEALPQERINQLYQWNYAVGGVFRVIVQQHKVVFGPQRDDV